MVDLSQSSSSSGFVSEMSARTVEMLGSSPRPSQPYLYKVFASESDCVGELTSDEVDFRDSSSVFFDRIVV